MAGLPFAPYEGQEPYIFVSYAHKNKVYPIIGRLDEMGYRLWYDKGIPPSAEWMGTIIEHLEKASYVLFFVSPEAIASDYVFTEVSIACDPHSRIPVCPIYLEEIKLTPRFKGCIYILQAVHKYVFDVEKDFYEELKRGLLDNGIQPASKTVAVESTPVIKVGSIYYFGPREMMKWRVLDVDTTNNRALLLSEDIVEIRPYNGWRDKVTWETCTLRKYLKGEFLRNFSEKDQARIVPMHNENPDNTWGTFFGQPFNMSGGKPTDDYIFLLSVFEVLKYFPGLKLHINADGDEWYYEADERLESKFSNDGYWWWLRSPGFTQSFATYVYYGGDVNLYGGDVDLEGGVRPALWLKI